MKRKIMSIFGTRPEAIKMAPVIKALENRQDDFISVVCVTAQHRQMLDQVLKLFDIRPDYDLDLMKPDQNLFEITCNVLQGVRPILERERPDIVLVHGDTTTTLAASIASYYLKTRIGHIEAGLRTHNKHAPFPEEMNRHLTGVLADLHFAPTAASRDNLLSEGVADISIHITGNTVIDALLTVSGKIDSEPCLKSSLDNTFGFLNPARKLILVTGHRRENFGTGFENICQALVDIAKQAPDVEIVYPVHLNPKVQTTVELFLKKTVLPNIHIIQPLDYLPFIYLLKRSYLVITDSGGVQEEAPSLGKPVLAMRTTTERFESISAGTVKLVGTDREAIVRETMLLLTNPEAYRAMSLAHNPYGDGKASDRIIEVLSNSPFLKAWA